jgi:hypothetical protein
MLTRRARPVRCQQCTVSAPADASGTLAERAAGTLGSPRETFMSNKRTALMRPLKLYASGHLALLVGAWAMSRDRLDAADGAGRVGVPDADGAARAPLSRSRRRQPLIAAVVLRL